MFQFLHPVWLWSAASVAVPIAIHFWNRKPPKIVWVGSIQFMEAATNQNLSRFTFAQPWLLLLRCLLLLLLALVLAGLHWKREIITQPQKHVYLHPALLKPTYISKIAAAVDSLAAQGWRVHRLQPGFPEISLSPEKSIITFADKASATPDTTNAWPLLEILNQSLPAQAQAHIFSTDLLRHHHGALPQMRSTFHWVPVSVPQKSIWLQNAFYTQDGQLQVQFGQADGADITFSTKKISKPTTNQTLPFSGFPEVRFTWHAQVDSLSIVTDPKAGIALAKKPMEVLVRYSKNRQPDVKYIRAALQTALEFHGTAFNLSISAGPQPLPTSAPDWIFWLTDEPLDAFLARFSKNRLKTLQDAASTAPVSKEKSWLQIPSLPQNISLSQRTPVAELYPATEVLWQDGFGQPMLTLQEKTNHSHYRFYSRFHPAWNNLPDDGNFPELLLRLLFPDNASWKKYHDTRTLPEHAQTPQLFSTSFSKNSPRTAQLLDLKFWLLALIALLLALERWLAARTSFKS